LKTIPLKPLYANLEVRSMRVVEYREGQRSKVALVCSDRDRSLLQALCSDCEFVSSQTVLIPKLPGSPDAT